MYLSLLSFFSSPHTGAEPGTTARPGGCMQGHTGTYECHRGSGYRPEHRVHGSGVRGTTGTSCKTEEREVQGTQLRYEGVAFASQGEVPHEVPQEGSKMHSISCSFYLFALPSISSRALSSLALASYSSSMNSCCRFLPERKKSHSQSFAALRKGQI